MPPAVLLCLGHFAPPTVAHLRAFERARDFIHLALDVRVVEGILAPLPGESHGLSHGVRIRLVEAAVRRSSWLRLGSWQCSQSSSTPRPITTIFHYATESRKKYGEGCRLFVLCGDSVLLQMGEGGLHGLWTQPELDTLLTHHGLLVVKKGSSSLGDFIYRHEVFRRHQKNIHVIEDETFPNYLNSDRVRTALRRGESVRYCVEDDVLDYIQDLHLFDSHHKTASIPPSPPSPPRIVPSLSWGTPPPSETSTQGESQDGLMPTTSGISPILTGKQLFPCADSPLLLAPLAPFESAVQLEQLMEKAPRKEHCSATIITLSPSRRTKKKRNKEERKKKNRPEPLETGPRQPKPLSPTYDNVTLEELLEASTSWCEFMGKQKEETKVYRSPSPRPRNPPTRPPSKSLPAAPPPPIPPRPGVQQSEKKSWFCNRKQEEDLVGICATDRRKLGQLSPEIFRKWTKFEDECKNPQPRKTSSARYIDHFRSQSPDPMSQSLTEGRGVTLTFRRYHLAPSAPETTV